jgi:hypothetical protein
MTSRHELLDEVRQVFTTDASLDTQLEYIASYLSDAYAGRAGVSLFTEQDMAEVFLPRFEQALLRPDWQLVYRYQVVAGVCYALQTAHVVAPDVYHRSLFPLWARTVGYSLELYLRSMRNWTGLEATRRHTAGHLLLDLACRLVWNNHMLLYVIQMNRASVDQWFLPGLTDVYGRALGNTPPIVPWEKADDAMDLVPSIEEIDDDEAEPGDTMPFVETGTRMHCSACGKSLRNSDWLAHVQRMGDWDDPETQFSCTSVHCARRVRLQLARVVDTST